MEDLPGEKFFSDMNCQIFLQISK